MTDPIDQEQPTPPSSTESAAAPSTHAPNEDAKLWAMLCHLTALAGSVFPVGNVLGPLICWLVKKDDDPFIDHHGKESLNFQITVTIAVAVCIPLMFVCIGFPLAAAVVVGALVFVIIAAIKANKGELYQYPYTLRIIK